MGKPAVRSGVSSLDEVSVTEPANNFGGPTPVFRVADVDASVAYYTQALGYQVQFRWGDDFA